MNNQPLTGGCHCGAVTVEVYLPSEAETYHPRACDCNFCRKHDAAYLSDPDGAVAIQTDHRSGLNIMQQGDNLAEFLCCGTCGQLIGVRWHQYGSINARVITDGTAFGEEITASPKKLSAEEKTSRWEALWFSEFVVKAVDL